jgi:deazaflavin-dependent oxidoreductase (nitroreductase family)
MVEVTGRRSGKTISFPAVVADYGNGRYLVSMLGEDTNWVRNVRASGGRVVLRHGDREPVTLREIDVARRAPILRCYLQRAPGPGRTFRLIGGRPSKRSNQSRRNTRCSA